MEVPPYAGAGFEPSSGSPSSGSPSSGPLSVEPAIAELARRLDAVEAGVGHLGGRLEALAVSLEASFETAVATEVQAAAAELRHTVSELGRILVRDLGKLPQMLAQHRQAIIAELRGARAPGPAREPAQLSPAPPGDGPTGPSRPDPGPAGPGPVPVDQSTVLRGAAADPNADADADADADIHDQGSDADADTDNQGSGTDDDNGPDLDPGAGGDRNWRGHLRRRH
ncbi:MAG: hypothetical protein ACR2LJ_13185 [Acidimicrobiales bacterium]